jgi:CCR4-NOT transcription complex subunit 1
MVVDRYIQSQPPHFDEQAKSDLVYAINLRYQNDGIPTDVLASLYLLKLLNDRNTLTLSIKRIGSAFTSDEEACRQHLQSFANININEEQVSAALLYTAISRVPTYSPATFVAALRKEVPQGFDWQQVVRFFDQEDLRISKEHFLTIYNALRLLAISDSGVSFDVQLLWGGNWQHTETQLSFITAFASLSPEELDATTIPGLRPSFTLADYEGAPPSIYERATRAIRHPLVSVVALTAIFNNALLSPIAADSQEAKRLFQEVVVPNLDIFFVSACGVPKPWPDLANDTVNSLFDRFFNKYDQAYDFVLHSLWRKDKSWVVARLIEIHAKTPNELPKILDHAIRHDWIDELTLLVNGFGLDFAALAHARGLFDLDRWAQRNAHSPELAPLLSTFLKIKAEHELTSQRNPREEPQSVMLPVKTILALLNLLKDRLPKTPSPDLIIVERACITAYPRMINYGEGFDDIIDENGRNSNSLPKEANDKMEEHYKRMYSDELQVRSVVEALEGYKRSRNPADQDVFACMIHGLFDEYALYQSYPLEALATTAVLFGGIISHKLISDLPLEIGLGMILEAVRDYPPDESMYKFGLQALMQLFSRLREWPGFCRLLLEVPGLQGTEAWKKAEEVVREQSESMVRNGNGAHKEHLNGATATNGAIEDMLGPEPTAPAFTAINVDPPSYGTAYEEPSGDTQEKVLFVLNNITERNLESKFQELKDVIDDKHQQWFAEHLVEERAKMQPNYHQLYLDLVRLFENKSLWTEVLRGTYVSVTRMLNAEATMQSSTERTHLKNLGGWLGSLTLARDRPIKHRNIAFKQLLLEAFDTQRLIVVIPFVCKVLIQGATSTIFKPPNPWLMDIIHLLIELYHHAELKLNLKFEIEVLCKGLNLDHKSIEPSTDIQTRSPPVEEPTETTAPEVLERFDNLSLNGIGGGVGSGRFSPQEITSTIPDLGPLLVYPPANDMVNQARLQEIVRTAITRAVHEIISPVVERSVTIAAISTAQMIHKDFATEPDEARVRSAAINMVKRTAGSLALVTSKEPLRASMSNYIRLLQNDLPQGLPEGTIIMCVNSNLDMACSQVEKKAEERAVPEIEEMIEPDLAARRQHRMTRPGDPFVDPSLSRWAWTIPNPFKLMPNVPGGLNPEQMAIYDEFARQPRIATLGPSAHVQSASDATRTMANEVLQDQYPSVPNLPTPAETPAMPLIPSQQQSYARPAPAMANGRVTSQAMDLRTLVETIQKLITDLMRVATEAPEQRWSDLPRPHPILDIVDALISVVIRNSQASDDAALYTAENICQLLFSTQVEDSLAVESFVHVLETLCKFPGRVAKSVVMLVATQADERLLSVPLAFALLTSEMQLLDFQRLDFATSKAIQQRKDGSMEFLLAITEKVLFNERPSALRTDFAYSLESAGHWLSEDPEHEAGRQLAQKLKASGLPQSEATAGDQRLADLQGQMEYIFDEWVHLCNNSNATDKAIIAFILQMHSKQIINDVNDSCLFFRFCVDVSVLRHEQMMPLIHEQMMSERHDQLIPDRNLVDSYVLADALAKLIARLVVHQGERDGEVKGSKPAYLKSILSLIVLVLNHHHVMRGEQFRQKPFFRIFSTMLSEFTELAPLLQESDREAILLTFAEVLQTLQPQHFPGFTFAWIALITHRDFMPYLLRLPSQAGWAPFAKLLESLLLYAGELLKPLQIANYTRSIYRGVVKALIVVQHDYPEFLAANSARLCAAIPSHCVQLQNIILSASPTAFTKMPSPLDPGLKLDRIDEIRDSPTMHEDIQEPLRQAGLLDVLDQAMSDGPSEDAVAHISHAIHRKNGRETTAGFLPVNVNLSLINATVMHIGVSAVAKAAEKNGPTFVSDSPDMALLRMLVHELQPEARFYFLNAIVNQLRFPNAHTHYFSQALLELFGNDQNDQEESDIRQQITRIMLERLNGHFPQPWGLIVTILELIKNEKYMFFELPFIKSAPEVSSPTHRD